MVESARQGDLVFRYQGESSFSQAVSKVVRGWEGLAIDHVAVYEGDGWVWEAGQNGVRRVAVASWTGGIVLGRLPDKARIESALVPAVLTWIREREGLPYNATFDQKKNSYYCSELVIDAFRHVGLPLFHETPLTFQDPGTGQTLPYWAEYYGARGLAVPEGQPGSHPARLSLSSELTMVHWRLPPV